MRSLSFKQATAAAILLALPVSLTACSSHKADKAGVSSPTTATPAPTGSTDAGGGNGGSKPTKAEVAAGMTNYFVGKGVPRSLVGNVTNCVADKGYTQFSDTTLNALKDGKIDKLNPLDAAELTKVTTTCLASGSILPSSG